jgi:CMP-N-acetylneuraminic acid synthetase
MTAVAFIFARGGSKGVPGKNTRLLCGKPLIQWSIEHALSTDAIDRLIVSTDSDEIATVALNAGAEVPFLRPKELATDSAPEWRAWQHALKFFQESEGTLPELMVSLPATSPLREKGDIESCIDEFQNSKADIVITISEAHRSPYFNMVKVVSDGRVELVIKPESSDALISRRQDAPEVFDIATACYVANPKFILANNDLFSGSVRAVQIPRERALDIDTMFDFEMAEFLMNKRLNG